MKGIARDMYPAYGDRRIHHFFRRRRPVGRNPGRYRPASRTGRRIRTWVPLLALSFGLLPVFVPAAAAAGTPSLVSAVFDVDVVLVGARDFPKRAALTIDATAEDLGGRATVQTNDEGRVVLGFRVPAGFSGKVDVKAASGGASASTSISIDVPTVVPAPTPGPSDPATPTPPTPPNEPPGGGPTPAPQPSPPGPGGGGGGDGPDWGTPMMRDDFNGGSVDTTKWSVYHSPTAKQFPRSRNSVRVADGELQLIGGVQDGLDVSGGISNKINQTSGRWRARIKVDRGSGYSGVVLLWPKTDDWPTDGEVDIVEVTGGDRQGAIMVVHNGASDQRVLGRVKTDFTQWVTVGVEWTRDHLAYYVGGENVFTVKAGNGPKGVNRIPSTSPMHMTLQFDKGCVQTLPCRTASTPAKVVMHVDWAEVYSLPT
jgi:hypothetical protein